MVGGGGGKYGGSGRTEGFTNGRLYLEPARLLL